MIAKNSKLSFLAAVRAKVAADHRLAIGAIGRRRVGVVFLGGGSAHANILIVVGVEKVSK
jgi:hypothetical protein